MMTIPKGIQDLISIAKQAIALVVGAFILAGCGGGGMSSSNATVSEAVLKKVAEKKIYFGHQSVGFNIIEGIDDILKEKTGNRLHIVKTDDPAMFKSPLFGHSTVGSNDDPTSKVQDFSSSMERGLGNTIDIAFFKFCYIDIHKGSDIGKIFMVYKETMDRLRKEYPKTRFVHVTVPLTVTEPSVKTFIKKVLGKEDNNIKRNAYNELLLKEYAGKEPVFDLAKVESTYPDGRKNTFSAGGKQYPSLVPDYSDDGGHLNLRGRRVVAAELLKFLASVE